MKWKDAVQMAPIAAPLFLIPIYPVTHETPGNAVIDLASLHVIGGCVLLPEQCQILLPFEDENTPENAAKIVEQYVLIAFAVQVLCWKVKKEYCPSRAEVSKGVDRDQNLDHQE